MDNENTYPIKQSDLKQFALQTKDIITITNYKPRTQARKYGDGDSAMEQAMDLRNSGKAESFKTSAEVLLVGNKINNESSIIFSEACNIILRTLQMGLQVGAYVGTVYAKSTQLNHLLSHLHTLSDTDKSLLRAKQATQGAITAFCAAKYIVWSLKQFQADKVTNATLQLAEIPDVDLTNEEASIKGMLFYYVSMIKGTESIQDEYGFFKLTILYFEEIMKIIKEQSQGLRHATAFTDIAFSLEETDFSIDGFDSDMTSIRDVKIARLEWQEIIGNKRQKRMMKQISQFLASYNFHVGKNPVLELVSNFPNIVMGDGFPGTGKTMMARATATYLTDLCEMRGVPFMFHEFPKTIKSKWVGGTADATKAWFSKMRNTEAIVYAPIDDAEGMLKDRGASDGSKDGSADIVQLFLTETEGATSVYSGRWMMHVLTNYPELIDGAVMSRIKNREGIPGAETVHDFMDQIQLWRDGMPENLGGYDNLVEDSTYQAYSDQGISFDQAIKSVDDYKPQREEVQGAYADALKHGDPTEKVFFGHLLYYLQQRDKRFTSREVRNVQVAVDNRRLNFFYPDEWMENPDIFFNQHDYNKQVELLNQLMIDNLGGQKMSDIFIVELLMAADNFFRINSNRIERKAKERAEWEEICDRGHQIYLDKKNTNSNA